MDRIKRISREILHDYKDDFGVDFLENKKILNKISIIRSKELKNELAGYITKIIKREIREKTENERKIASQSKEYVEEVETKTLSENQSNEKNQEQPNEENNASTEPQKTP